MRTASQLPGRGPTDVDVAPVSACYEGESISNQPIPFQWTEKVTIFMLCFNICFIHGYKIACISSHSLIRY